MKLTNQQIIERKLKTVYRKTNDSYTTKTNLMLCLGLSMWHKNYTHSLKVLQILKLKLVLNSIKKKSNLIWGTKAGKK